MKPKENNLKGIRWKQRFENYRNAFLSLEEAIEIKKPSEVERAGLIQFFELTFELSWKVLKDYLEAQGFDVKSPRETLKQAYQIELIQNGHHWVEALDDRNLTTHTYDKKMSLKVAKLICKKYYPLLKSLYEEFKEKL